jgi:hypothetical protein
MMAGMRAGLRNSLTAALSALVVIALGVSLEWLLLTGSSPQAVIRASMPPTAQPVLTHLPDTFQTGVIFPQWNANAYSASNTNWSYGLTEINQQTGAGWIEMPITLYQDKFTDTTLGPNDQTPTPASLADGIRMAHARHLHVFVVPFVTVQPPDGNPDTHWSGDIGNYDRSLGATRAVLTYRWRQAWFDGYWQALKPYVQAAAQAGAEQFAIGTEMEHLEGAPNDLWNTFIERIHAEYPGMLTYDMNWSAECTYTQGCNLIGHKYGPIPDWMKNPLLSALGVSEYRPLVGSDSGDVTDPSATPDPSALPTIWRLKIKSDLDALSGLAGKPVILSEIGYRNSTDALIAPWQWSSSSPADPSLQAAAYDAALKNVTNDEHIAGIFFWGWSVPSFEPNWLPAAQVLHLWYTQPRASQQDRPYGYTWPDGRTTSS